MLNYISTLIMPTIIILILTNGLIKKVPLFDHFLTGAKDGFDTSVKILPSLVGLISNINATGIRLF